MRQRALRWLAALLLMPALAMSQDFDVAILSPSSNTPVFGETEFLVNIYPADVEVEAIDFFVDGRKVGERIEPPWSVTTHVGQDFRSRVFRVTVYVAGGDQKTVEVRTPELQIDEELGVELQQLYVTVLRDQRRVLDLAEGNFRIFDDGGEQELVTFARGDIPLAAALVLDASGSMAGERIEAALAGARIFVRGMRELDEAAIFLFSDDLMRSTDFSGDVRILEAALKQVEVAGRATAINDHLYMALKQLDSRQGRRVVLLLSDGADVHSVLGMEEVLWKAQRSQALIYWIRVEEEGRYDGGRFNSTWRNYLDNEKEWDLLEQAVEDSGGRIVRADVDGVESAFREILAELREQYVLGYYPSNIRNDGSWHKVRVRTRNGSFNIRTRNGYIDF